MSYNGSGTFLINSAGQPVVANTVISATVFNALTSDLATGLSTAITKDGQTTITANIPFGNNKITGLAAGTAATDSANLGQVQSTAAKLITVTGTDTITGSMSPALTAYAAGQLFYFVAAGANTGAVTINIDGLGAKSVTRDGATALANGDINSGEVVVLVYDGTRFQMINAANSFGNTTINGTLTVTGNTGLQANVSITSALSVGGTFNVTGAAALGSTLAVTGKSDLPTVSTASMNAAVALITTGTVTNFTSTSASIASANVGTAVITTGTVTNLTSTSASIASANAAVALVTTGTVTNLTSTSASIASANLGTAVVTGLTVTGASIASVNVGAAVLSGNLTLSGGTANGVLYLNGSKVATSGSALTFDGSVLVSTSAIRANSYMEIRSDTANLYWENAANTRYYSMALSGTSTSPTLLTTYFDGTSVLNRLALDSSGNLGIGTASPAGRVSIKGSTADSSANALFVENSSAAATFRVRNDGDIYMGIGGKAILDSSGNLGIGMTSPDDRLVVSVSNPTDGRVASLRNTGTSSLTGTKLWFNQNTVDNWNIGQPAGVNAFVFCNSTGSTNERARIDASGNLLVGTTSSILTGVTTSVSSNGAVGYAANNVNTGTSAYSNYQLGNANSSNRAGLALLGSAYTSTGLLRQDGLYLYCGGAGGMTLTTEAAQPIYFGTNNTERARITATGELLVGVTSATANGGVIQVSNGITFPATQSASSNANTLDDYEEGTWTPTLVGSTTAGTYTFSTSHALYTKIGRAVYVSAFLLVDTASGGVGAAKFGGLPFTKSANQAYTGSAVTGGVDLAANTMSLSVTPWTISSASTEFSIAQMQDNAGAVDLDIAGISSTDVIAVSFTYFV